MADLLDLEPLFPDDDLDSVMDRMQEYAHEGIDPSSPRYVDVRDLAMFTIINGPVAEQIAKLYDLAGVEVIAAGIIITSFGPYLDRHAEVFELVRNPATFADGEITFAGEDGTLVPAGTQVEAVVANPDDDVPTFQTLVDGTIDGTGSVTIAVRATEAGVIGNVGPAAATEEGSPIVGVTARSNAEAIVGGVEAEDDEGLRKRLILRLQPAGPGNQKDYIRWSLDEPGVGRVTVIPIADGPNTVTVIISTVDGDPNSSDTVDHLQATLDPDPDQGAGEAPIGVAVTVETTTLLNIDATAAIEFDTGYTLDGDSGTFAMRDVVTAAVAAYVNALPPAGEVVRQEVEAKIMDVDGVHDLADITLTGAGPNGNIQPDPNEVPRLDTLTLSETTI